MNIVGENLVAHYNIDIKLEKNCRHFIHRFLENYIQFSCAE